MECHQFDLARAKSELRYFSEIKSEKDIKEEKQSVAAAPAKTPVEDEVDLSMSSRIGIDTMNADDGPQMCAPYATGICEYLRDIKAKRRPIPNYIEKVQTDISAKMRGVLFDYLVEVAEEYKLDSDTLYLTASYIDRYLSTNFISRKKLQLICVSSMLIASCDSILRFQS